MNMGSGMQGFPPQIAKAMNPHQFNQDKSHFKNMPTLFFTDLSPDVYNLDLYKFIESKGFRVYKTNVLMDKRTNKNKCCGYATFNNKEEAQRALDALNYTKFKGKEIRIMWANKDKPAESANIYIKKIAPEFDQSDIQSYFQKFGKVVSCKIEKWPDGTSRGFGYLQFEEESKAGEAINESNNTELTKTITMPDGTQNTIKCLIEVSPFQKKLERLDKVEQPFTNLYVKHLPTGCTEEMLKSLFEKFGEIESVKIQLDKDGKSLDFGYVDFKETDAAHKALKEMDKHLIEEGKVLYVSRHYSKKEIELQSLKPNSDYKMQQKQHNNSNLFVKNLPENLTEEDFKKPFEAIGNVLSTKLVSKDRDGKLCVSHGYVLYEKIEDAQKAIMKLSEENIFCNKPLKMDFWRSKEDIKNEIE